MTSVERFEDLDVWKRAKMLANLVYDLSTRGNFARDFGLRDQMQRAAVSVMSNIAEGFESRTQARFIEYLGHAKASAGELRAQSYLALDRKYISQDQFQELHNMATVCSKQIAKLSEYLQSRPNAQRIREGEATYEV